LRGLLAFALCAGCATYPVDRDYDYRGRAIASFPVDKVPVRGAPVSLELTSGRSPWGELLAADRGAVWLESAGAILRYPLGDVRAVDLKVMPANDMKGVGAWAGLSNFVAAGHGIWAMASWPAFSLIVGGLLLNAGLDNRLRIEPAYFSFLPEYARFPQGLPPSLAPRARAAIAPTGDASPRIPAVDDAGSPARHD
jgi:hypothetical protein